VGSHSYVCNIYKISIINRYLSSYKPHSGLLFLLNKNMDWPSKTSEQKHIKTGQITKGERNSSNILAQVFMFHASVLQVNCWIFQLLLLQSSSTTRTRNCIPAPRRKQLPIEFQASRVRAVCTKVEPPWPRNR
jgi:hypothetical protein